MPCIFLNDLIKQRRQLYVCPLLTARIPSILKMLTLLTAGNAVMKHGAVMGRSLGNVFLFFPTLYIRPYDTWLKCSFQVEVHASAVLVPGGLGVGLIIVFFCMQWLNRTCEQSKWDPDWQMATYAAFPLFNRSLGSPFLGLCNGGLLSRNQSCNMCPTSRFLRLKKFNVRPCAPLALFLNAYAMKNVYVLQIHF